MTVTSLSQIATGIRAT